MSIEKTWRWFGFNDTVTLQELKQIGVEGIVTSLHHLKPGEIWEIKEIDKVKNEIEKQGFRWSVVESLPVSEEIKLNSDKSRNHIENYKRSLINLSKCGIDTVCYNFMPVLDWARTDVQYIDADGAETMLFDLITFAAFDIFILQRPNAERDYLPEICLKAKEKFEKMEEVEKEKLSYNIIVYTQGFINSAVIDSKDYISCFIQALRKYKEVDEMALRQHFSIFIKEVVPVAEKHGIKLCIHPDDPAFPLLGLPRIVSTIDDLEWIFSQNESIANGFTLCTGSLASRKGNNPVEFVKRFSDRIHFVHLRNIQFIDDTSFFESGHLSGSIDIYEVIESLLKEQHRRKKEGREDIHIPMRVDHGKKILDDFSRKSNPGYPLIGRLKGLAEISGLIAGIERGITDFE
ncbi:mannonate dehydratase [Petrimonas sp.]|uniref:mannonate dehydratase n=1 Tax=Petrimonas sp. TaxID=2023866 RepID=UPI003F515D0B